MKILLIAPASGPWRAAGRSRFINGRTFRFSMLSLLTVAAATPPDVQVHIVDEQIDDIPWDAEVDLVGITCMTALAPRAWEIAARFRARGVPVVLGGMHPTLNPDEALLHADAVVAGEAEGAWPEVVADARARRLRGLYRTPAPDLARLNRPPRHLLAPGRYASALAIQATRGCPHRCSFCSIAAFCGGRQRQRPVEDVAAEVAASPSRFVIFVDDNLTADRDYAAALFRAMEPLGKFWITQSSLAVAEDEPLARAMARAGCVGIFAGLETPNPASLEGAGKDCHRAERYREGIRRLHALGIGVEAGIVFGFEADGPEVFEKTLGWMDDLEIDVAQISILTPIPGTPLHNTMQGRIFDRDWSRYDFHHAVFEPRGMSAGALKAGHDWVTREFYRPWRIARRLGRCALRPRPALALAWTAAINGAYWARVQAWGIRGENPAKAAGAARERFSTARLDAREQII